MQNTEKTLQALHSQNNIAENSELKLDSSHWYSCVSIWWFSHILEKYKKLGQPLYQNC